MRRFRVLVVEDDDGALNQLGELVAKAVPGVVILTARTVAEAHRVIDAALAAQKPFDLAILDFKLPPNVPGENPEIDFSICQKLMRTMPQALRGHLTSYIGNSEVAAHHNEAHPPNQKRGFVLSKLSDWEDLPRFVRWSLYDPWIENEIGELEAATSPHPAKAARSGERSRPAGITMRLMSLKLDIARYFGYLSPTTQQWLQGYFEITPRVGVEPGDPVRYEVRSRLKAAL